MYLNNECISAHLFWLFKLSCHCLRRCVPRLPLREHVLRRRRGPGKYTYLITYFSLVAKLWAFSWYPVRYPDIRLVYTLCGTLIFSWYPVSAHWTPTRDLTSRELAWNHIAWVTSRLTLQGAPHHTLDSLFEYSLIRKLLLLNTWLLLPRTEPTYTS